MTSHFESERDNAAEIGAGTIFEKNGSNTILERTDDMENKFIRADDVAQELRVSKPYAYKLIRKLNEELKAQGFITISGRVNRQYFYERLYGEGNPQRDTTMSCKAGRESGKGDK